MSPQKPSPTQTLFVFLTVVATAVLVGCPSSSPPPTKQDAKVSLVVGSNVSSTAKAELAQEKNDVISHLIASLTISITQISVDYAGTEPPNGGDVQTIELLNSPIDVDIFHLDLTGLTQILSDAQLPAGYYTALHIAFENPRLILQTDLDTTILDITITGQGQVTANTTFQLPEGDCILLVDFGGIHFSIDAQGALILTPNITIEVLETGTEVQAIGEIEAVHPDRHDFEMSAGEADLLVLYADADIYLPTDDYTPTGTPEDLQEGAKVKVVGAAGPEHSIVATEIYILELPDDGEVEEVEQTGVINAINRDTGEFEMSLAKCHCVVQYADADIFLPTDEDIPTGTPEDLDVGVKVRVIGTRTGDGPIVASRIRILQAEVEVHKIGVIDVVHRDENNFEMSSGDDDFVVQYGEALIFLPTDGDDPTGTPDDLDAGLAVEVRGTRLNDGPIVASKVRLLDV